MTEHANRDKSKASRSQAEMRFRCAAARASIRSIRMANIHDDPAALKALQDDIYRERILRARKMTLEQRLAESLELTNGVFVRMHEGAMWQLGTTDAERGWQEVRRRLARLGRVHDEGRFVNSKPATP
jgi:hypothetical protein